MAPRFVCLPGDGIGPEVMAEAIRVLQALGLPFEEQVVPLYDAEWDKRREGDEFAPSSGKVPILWDGECVVWDSLAIIEYLNEQSGGDKFWPKDTSARAMARSMAAEMHSGFAALRRKLGTDLIKTRRGEGYIIDA